MTDNLDKISTKSLKTINFIETKSLTEKDFLFFRRNYSFGKLLFLGTFLSSLFLGISFMLSRIFLVDKNVETPTIWIVLFISIPLLLFILMALKDIVNVLEDKRGKIKFVGFGVLKEKYVRTNEDSPDNYILSIQLEKLSLTAFTDRNFFDIIELGEVISVEFLPKSKKIISIIYKDKAREIV